LTGDGAAGDRSALRRGASSVKAVFSVAHLETIERAIRQTGEANRGAALLQICEAYLAQG
jgi:hypothetical protein